MPKIHPLAIVHENALIADDVEIGPFAIIGENVTIDSGTTIGANALIEGHTKIGKNNKIFPSSYIGLPPQDIKYNGDPTRVVIGDNNIIREFTTIHASNNMNEDTTIGSNNMLMAYSHVAHNCVLKNNIFIANAVQLAGHVHVYDFAIIGGQSAIQQNVRIGKFVFFGGASATSKDVPPFVRCQGNRKLSIGGINIVGLSRNGYDSATIEAISKIHKIFYFSKMNFSQAIEHCETLTDLSEEQLLYINFFKETKVRVIRHNAE